MNLVFCQQCTLFQIKLKQYNVDARITFDQPLYWKALEIQNTLPDSSQLKLIVLRLEGLHTFELPVFYWLPNDLVFYLCIFIQGR